MVKYYYNGVLLPEIPVVEGYSYCFIRYDEVNSRIDCVYSNTILYYNDSDSSVRNASENNYKRFIANISNPEVWNESSDVNYGGWTITSNRKLLWSNHNIPNGSATSTTIYFYATEPIKEEEYVSGIQSDITLVTLGSAIGKFELGNEFKFNKTVTALAIRIYAPSGSQVSKGTLWDESGTKLSETNSVTYFGGQWWTLTFLKPITLEAGKNYIVSAGFSSYHIIESANLTFSDAVSFVQSRYTQSLGTFPSTAFNSKVYGLVDVVYQGQASPTPSTYSKYLIQSGDSIFTVTDGVLTAVDGSLTAELFRTYGVDEIPSSELLVTLTDPVVLYWVDTTDHEISSLVAVQQALPFTQTLESEDYNMNHPSIVGIEKVFVDASDDVRFAVSFDKGQTWKTHTGQAWATLSEGDTGMSPSVLSAITTEDWNAEATTGKFRFRVTLSTVDDYVNSLVVDYLN